MTRPRRPSGERDLIEKNREWGVLYVKVTIGVTLYKGYYNKGCTIYIWSQLEIVVIIGLSNPKPSS